jgi:hypothetical protein
MTSWDKKDYDYYNYKNRNDAYFNNCSRLAQTATTAPSYCSNNDYTSTCANLSIQVGGTTAVTQDLIQKLSLETNPAAGTRLLLLSRSFTTVVAF